MLVLPEKEYQDLADNLLSISYCTPYREKILCDCELREFLPPITLLLGDDTRQFKFQIKGEDYLKPIYTRNLALP